jgi:RNA polymerase sigma-70 factor (ECF subfamily)
MPKSLRDEVVALYPAMKAFAYRFTKSSTDAEDLAQETIVRALARLDLFEPGTCLKSWMFTILRNHFCTQYKRAKRFRLASDICEQTFDIPVPSQQEWSLRLSDVSEEIDRLPEQMREALMLIIAGSSYNDAAKVCGCEVGTIKSRVGRARMSLMAALSETSSGDAAAR